jgi:hypothetical protein
MAAWDTNTVDKLKVDMDSTLDGISIEEVKTEGMTIRIGGKVVKLEITEELSLPEDDIRAEYSKLLTDKLQMIKGVLNDKMSELTYMVEQNRQDFEEKERALQMRLSEANLMPNITYEQAKSGLSVVKGNQGYRGEADVLTWLFQGVYWPKYVDQDPIDPKYAKRLISPVTLEVVTVKDRVRSVTVRKTIGLGKFRHYHAMGGDSDCWGQWSIPQRFKEPSDILDIARHAMGVLENVNTGSPGDRSPSGLPRLETLRQHVLTGEAAKNVSYGMSKADERAGITEDTDRGLVAQVWST